ncbi:MAG TPA: recombinase family protein [Ruminococcaceae bacterium]|nr:recombinase family protein [Oscillospiraceae bacterium]
MKIAAAYIRVSTDDQLEFSPDSQLEKILDYAKHNNIIIPAEYIFREKEGISGRSAAKRPEFQRMIATARKKDSNISMILVWKFSRFARNQEESIVYKSLLKKERSISVVSVSEPISDTDFGGLIERIIEWMDGYYSTRLSGEVMRGMTERFQRGKPVSAAPFGYLMPKGTGKLMIDPQAAPVVQYIFERFLAGDGYKQIALNLNAQGIKTRRGNLWESRTIRYIIQNPIYIGKIRWNPTGKNVDYYKTKSKITDGDHDPIISGSQWKAAQKRVETISKLYGHYAHSSKPAGNLFCGLIKCSACGATMSPVGGAKKGGLQCTNYTHSRCTESHYISNDKLRRIVFSEIKYELTYGTFSLQRKNTKPDGFDNSKIQNKIEREQHKLDRAKDSYTAGVDTLEEYKENKQKIMAEIKKLKAKLSVTPTIEIPEAQQKAFCKKALKNLQQCESLPPGEGNRILRTFIDHIVFDRASDSIQIFYYL